MLSVQYDSLPQKHPDLDHASFLLSFLFLYRSSSIVAMYQRNYTSALTTSSYHLHKSIINYYWMSEIWWSAFKESYLSIFYLINLQKIKQVSRAPEQNLVISIQILLEIYIFPAVRRVKQEESTGMIRALTHLCESLLLLHVSLWFPQGGELTQPTSAKWLMPPFPCRLCRMTHPLLSTLLFLLSPSLLLGPSFRLQ